MLENFLHINKLAVRYFERRLSESMRGQQLVHDRVSVRVASAYKLGFAPKEGLLEYLQKHSVDLTQATTLGLLGKDGDGYYETFRNRIMIPIVHAGVVVGFGGRDITNYSKAKYLNSKSSIVYDKSAVLFNLWQALDAIDRRQYVILVEGFFDVLALVDRGIGNVVAVCGTALKKQHVDALKCFTSKVVVLYDGDNAGQEAAKKAHKLLRSLSGGIQTLPGSMDPDDYIKKYGKKKLLLRIEN